MKKPVWMGMLAATLLSTAAYAEDPVAPDMPPPGGPMMAEGGPMSHESHKAPTLQEARDRAHKHAERMDKMTEEQWAERQKKRMERREKWQNMSEEERSAVKEKMRERRMSRQDRPEGKSGAPAAKE